MSSPFYLASDRAVLNRNYVFSILVVSTKNGTPVFEKENFKVKVLKTFETFTDPHVKTCADLSNGGLFYFENP